MDASGVEVSALAVHGEPLHPNPEIADRYLDEYQAVCRIAGALGVEKLVLLAGLPGGAPRDETPNWITYPFPNENIQRLEWQWSERLLPYWTEHARFADDHGVRLCFEMHPNDLVHDPRSLLKLRGEIGNVVGANLDPSHLVWRGMDIETVIQDLGEAVYHVHAKDAALDDANIRSNGVIDSTAFSAVRDRAWSFRTVGYGQSELWWRRFFSALRLYGYDGVVSIEHEDPLMDTFEGLQRAFHYLSRVLPVEPASPLWFE